MLSRCLQTGQQEQTSHALKENEGEDKDKDFIERISLDPSSHSSSGTGPKPQWKGLHWAVTCAVCRQVHW